LIPKYTKLTDQFKHKVSEDLRNPAQKSKRAINNVSLYFTLNLNITNTILAEALLFTSPCEYRQMKVISIDRLTSYCGNSAAVFTHQLFIQQKNSAGFICFGIANLLLLIVIGIS